MIVLHARALLCLAAAEPRSDWVLTQVVHDDLAAPAHQPAWVLSALVRLGRLGRLDDDEVDEAVQAVVSLPQRLEAPDARLVRRAQELAGVASFSDGLHLALAERLDVPLVVTHRSLTGPAVLDAVACEVTAPPAWLYPDPAAP